jgi:hypothetical protein
VHHIFKGESVGVLVTSQRILIKNDHHNHCTAKGDEKLGHEEGEGEEGAPGDRICIYTVGRGMPGVTGGNSTMNATMWNPVVGKPVHSEPWYADPSGNPDVGRNNW